MTDWAGFWIGLGIVLATCFFVGASDDSGDYYAIDLNGKTELYYQGNLIRERKWRND